MKPLDQWTAEDVEAFRAKGDAICRGIIQVTFMLCGAMFLWAYTYHGMCALLELV
jgi:hypothetical protein